MTRRRPVVFGEVLFDRFPDGERRLGGAPLNVAVHLAGLGADPLLVSRVGADPAGADVRAALDRHQIDTAGLQLDTQRSTGAVDVRFTDGEPSFDILNDRAWDAIASPPAFAVVDRTTPALLYHGVLATRAETSRQTLADSARGSTCPASST